MCFQAVQEKGYCLYLLNVGYKRQKFAHFVVYIR